MPIDDTFRWIADMPSVMLPADDHGIFLDLDESVSAAVNSPQPSPPNSNESILPEINGLTADLSALTLKSPDLTPKPLKSEVRRSGPTEPAYRFRSFTPLSSIPSLVDDVSELSMPGALPSQFTELNALVRDALHSPPEIPEPAAKKRLSSFPSLNQSFIEAPNNETPHQPSRLPTTVASPTSTIKSAISDHNLDQYPPYSLSPLLSHPPKSILDDLQTSPIAELPHNLLPSSAPNPKPPALRPRSVLYKLTDENWEAIRQLCSYLDQYPAEPVDRDTTLNICDIEDAANRLNIPLPLPIAVMEVMVRIGCQISSSLLANSPKRGWLAGAHACEQSIREREHEEYELERLREQQNLASVLSIRLRQRQFLQLWWQAWHARVYWSNMRLMQFYRQHTGPKFFKLWQLKVRRERLKTKAAQDINAATTLAAAVELWHARAESEFKLYETSHRVGIHVALKTAVRLWRHQAKLAVSGHKKAYEHWRHWQQQKLVRNLFDHFFLQKAQELRSVILRRTTLRNWRCRQQNLVHPSLLATHHRLAQHIKHWRQKTQDCQQNLIKSRSNVFAIPLARAYLQRWRHELYIVNRRQQHDYQRKLAVLKTWKQYACGQTLARQRTNGEKKTAIRYWRQRLAVILAINNRTTSLLGEGDRQGAKLCLDVWRTRYQAQRAWHASSIVFYYRTQQRQFLKTWRRLAATNAAAQLTATALFRHSQLAMSCKAWLNNYHQKRQQKLTELAGRTELTLLHRQCHYRLRQWRQRAKRERHQRRVIPQLLRKSHQRTVLRRWHAQLQTVLINQARARARQTEYFQRQAVQLWRQHATETRNMFLTADDLDLARLALAMRQTVQTWQLLAADRLAQRARAANYRQTQTRRLQLTIVTRWREKLGLTTAAASFSLYESPTKLAAVSPHLISKLRLRNESTPHRRQVLAANRANSSTPRTELERRQPLMPFTPTKPFRAPPSLPFTPAQPR